MPCPPEPQSSSQLHFDSLKPFVPLTESTGTAAAATWDIGLIEESGKLQGKEALAKGVSVLLGPTVNIQRSPLGGRGYESFSEDPYLSGMMAAATIRGMQSIGVAATLKHFVCNDQEHERMFVSALVTERALREIYLMPFMIAQRDAKPWCLMTSYNRVNGTHVSESSKLIRKTLREEWGFDGLVMSDWFGTYSTVEAVIAGLDLEMPGADSIRGGLISKALACGKLSTKDVDTCVREILRLMKRLEALGLAEHAPETTNNDTSETASFLREMASQSIVLLKNEKDTLPFKKDRSTAVIGPNAATPTYCGGGSSWLPAYYTTTPLDGTRKQTSHATYELGATGTKIIPPLSLITKDDYGKPGLTMRVFDQPLSEGVARESIDEIHVDSSYFPLLDYEHRKITSYLYWLEFTGTITPDETADYEFGLSVAGTGKLYVDGECIIDNETTQRPGTHIFGIGTAEERGLVRLQAGSQHQILVRFATLPTLALPNFGAPFFGAGGLKIGGRRKVDAQSALARAVELAKAVEQVLVCVGLDSEWESEGYDRQSMHLPPGVDALVHAVLEVNPNTAVVIQSGTPVTMPWLAEAPAVLQAWFGGNEAGNAIADVVFGDTNPSGKLPLTFPIANEHNPAFLNFRSDHGRALYGEDVYVGYRYYDKTKTGVHFPFGHGLSYTQLLLSNLNVEVDGRGESIKVTATISNIGQRDGAQVMQVYVAQLAPAANRPPKELKGFTKVFVKQGQSEKAEVVLSQKYATSYWDERNNAWVSEEGVYHILVGDSSVDLPLKAEFEVKETRWWSGI